MAAGQTGNFQATALNDGSNSGVTWSASCGSNDCGSFSPTVTTNAGTTYTAPATVPANGTVTVTATSIADSTKSASLTLTITGTGTTGGIAVVVTPAAIYLPTSGPARTTHFTATVTSDAAAAGVTWSLTCGSAACGSITPQTASGAAATYLWTARGTDRGHCNNHGHIRDRHNKDSQRRCNHRDRTADCYHHHRSAACNACGWSDDESQRDCCERHKQLRCGLDGILRHRRSVRDVEPFSRAHSKWRHDRLHRTGRCAHR